MSSKDRQRDREEFTARIRRYDREERIAVMMQDYARARRIALARVAFKQDYRRAK